MKILQIIPSLAKEGAERMVLDTCIELSKQEEIEVKLVTFHDSNAYSFLSKRIECKLVKLMEQFTSGLLERKNNFI